MSNLTRVGNSEHRRKTSVSTATAGCRSKVVGTTRQSGFTVIELLIACTVLVTITAIAVPHLVSALDAAKVARAVGDVRTIGNAVLGYEAVNHVFPTDLTQVGYASNLDPWGRPYQYLILTGNPSGQRTDRFNVPLNTYFDLYSTGKDRLSAPQLTAGVSQDDVVWAVDGGFDGSATTF